MGKIIAWLVLIFVVLLALRMINMRKRRSRVGGTGPSKQDAAQPMVRCKLCGVFLPLTEARKLAGGFACGDGQCLERR